MNDLISRQAAIDIVHELTKWYIETYHETRPTALAVIDKLMELPSAQPEIIRCKDCKHWTNNIGDSNLRDNFCNEAVHGFYYRCSRDDYCSKAERRTE